MYDHGGRAVAASPGGRADAWGYTFLLNKYYLDDLYEKVIVHGIAGPIARAAYWFNQHVIDGVVNGVGIGGRKAGGWVYRNIDQRVVDGAVNGSGAVARGAGGALRPVQSGKVNQYGALLFGARPSAPSSSSSSTRRESRDMNVLTDQQLGCSASARSCRWPACS